MSSTGTATSTAAELLERITAEPSYLTYHTVAQRLRELGPDQLSIPLSRRARVAVTGSHTLEPWAAYLLVEAVREGVWLELFCSGFNQFQADLLDPHSALRRWEAELVFVAAALEAVVPDASGPEGAERALARVQELTASFLHGNRSLLIWNNFIVPARSPYSLTPCAEAAAVDSLNRGLRDSFTAQLQVRVLDVDRLARFHGTSRVVDQRLAAIARMPWSPEFTAHVARGALAIIKAAKGLTRKCIVVDLDNTLWGGVVGEDGMEGLALGAEAPGNAFLAFQRALLAFRDKGVLLAINSKNNPEDALEVMRRHPEMVLREDHFAAIRINWDEKAANMRALAAELNLGLDSFVFIDDQPVERYLMRQALPEVLTPDWPADPSAFTAALEMLTDFESLQGVTEEDRSRGSWYQSERERSELRTQLGTLHDYLRDLAIVATVRRAAPEELTRVTQLIQKTNQFNLTTRRYAGHDVHAMMAGQGFRVYTLRVRDRFGDAGLVGVAVVRLDVEAWVLDTLLMSCRVMGRRIEHAFLGSLAQQARADGAKTLIGEYRPTAKNRAVADVYGHAGFEPCESHGEAQCWRLDLTRGTLPGEPLITVEDVA